MKTALFNLENLATQAAMVKVIEANKDSIKMVLVSHPYSKKNGSFLFQLYRNLKLRGLSFVHYLSCKMVLMPFYRFILRLLQQPYLPSLKTLCLQHNIIYMKVKDVNDKKVVDKLSALDIDLIQIFYFDQILQQTIIDTPNIGVINYHPAYLPQCRGLFPILFSYLYNKKKYGISAHWVENPEIDAGPLIEQVAVKFSDKNNLLETDAAVCAHFEGLYAQVQILLSNVLEENYNDKRRHIIESLSKSRQSMGSYYSYPSKQELALLRHSGLSLSSFFSGFKLLVKPQ
jgi:methionyl-tRNA formyltransferase